MTDRHFGALNELDATYRQTEYRLRRALRISQMLFDSLQSQNYVASTSGFRIDSSGTAEFNSGVTVNSDLYSGNWSSGGGSVPDDLSSGANASALLGYYLDYSAGAGQFQKIYARGGEMQDLTITGLLSVNASGDIYSTAWDGTNPANIGSNPDSGAAAGWWIDGGGAAQFMKIWAEGGAVTDLDITGTLTFSGGEINSGSAAPYISLTEASEDAGAAGHVLEFIRNLTDGRHPKIHATDDVIGLYSRHVGTSITDQAAVILSNEGKDTIPRIQLTLDQLDGNDGAWLQMWDVGDSVKGFELAGGTDWSAANLGAAEQFIRLWNKGDGGTVGIYGNPTSAEEILYVADGNPGSETLLFSVNSDGPATDNALTNFPTTVNGKPTNITTFANTNWIAGTAYTLWTHGGTNRVVEVWAIARFEWGETAAVAYTGECRLGVSFDGGSTWSYGQQSIHYMGTGTGGCGYRGSGTVMFNGESASATGDIQMRLEHKVGNTNMDRLINMELIGHAEQIF